MEVFTPAATHIIYTKILKIPSVVLQKKKDWLRKVVGLYSYNIPKKISNFPERPSCQPLSIHNKN